MDDENARQQAAMMALLRAKRNENATTITDHPSGASPPHQGSRVTTRTPPPAHTNARSTERPLYSQEGTYRRPQPEPHYGKYDGFNDEYGYDEAHYEEDDDFEEKLRILEERRQRDDEERARIKRDQAARNRTPPSNTHAGPSVSRQQQPFEDPRAQPTRPSPVRAPSTPQGFISQADQIRYLQEQLRRKQEEDAARLEIEKNEELIKQLTDAVYGRPPAAAPVPSPQAYSPYPAPSTFAVPPYVSPYASPHPSAIPGHVHPHASPYHQAPMSTPPVDPRPPQAHPAVPNTGLTELEELRRRVDLLRAQAAAPVVSNPSEESVARQNKNNEELRRLRAQLDATTSISSLRETVEARTRANAQIQYGIDVCFLLDCTGSMGSFIKAAKDKISEIIENVKRIEAKAVVKVAFVGYRDYGDAVKLETVDFIGSSELSSFKAHLSKCQATGGGDGPEDIAGGLAAVSRLSWSSSTRLVIHFADWPCHGTKYHDQSGDSYPSGDPEGLIPETFLTVLASEKRVDFYFMEISPITRKMTGIFQKTYAAAGRQFFVNPISASADEFVPKVVKSITSSMARSEAFGPAYDLEY